MSQGAAYIHAKTRSHTSVDHTDLKAFGMEEPRRIPTNLISQIVLVVATLAAVAGGLVLLVRDSSSGGGIEIVLPIATSAPQARVYLSGAVQNPGVYAVEEGDRLVQVIEAAGGTTQDADLGAVNLALRVKDEDHWHIPRMGEVSQAAPAQGIGLAGKVNINTADLQQLISLPGIGEVKAQAIISYREASGPFSNVEDLLAISGIGPVTLNGIRDLVEVR